LVCFRHTHLIQNRNPLNFLTHPVIATSVGNRSMLDAP
jgi:hypothetical protein